eukprot:10108081-Alexandrium_andersonii.AAC.1
MKTDTSGTRRCALRHGSDEASGSGSRGGQHKSGDPQPGGAADPRTFSSVFPKACGGQGLEGA